MSLSTMAGRRALILVATAAAVVAGAERCIDASEPPTIAVSILPQRAFVEHIAGDLVRVEVLVLPGHSPATYEPSPRQMARLAEADLWIRIGVPFERSVLRNLAAVAPNLRIIDGTRDIELAPMYGTSNHASNEHAGGHDHLTDPHFWLDPLLVNLHVRTVTAELCGLMPTNCDQFKSNLDRFQIELDTVHEKISKILLPIAGRDLFVFHPAYGYFCRRYGLRQVAVESGGKQPTARRLAELTDAGRASRTHALFVQPQFAGTGVQAVANAMDVDLVQLDPLAPDYLTNLEAMAERIAAAYGR